MNMVIAHESRIHYTCIYMYVKRRKGTKILCRRMTTTPKRQTTMYNQSNTTALQKGHIQ